MCTNELLAHTGKQLKGTAVFVLKHHTIKLWREKQLVFHTNCLFNYYVKYAMREKSKKIRKDWE